MGAWKARGGRVERADSACAIVSHRRSTRQQTMICRAIGPRGRLGLPLGPAVGLRSGWPSVQWTGRCVWAPAPWKECGDG